MSGDAVEPLVRPLPEGISDDLPAHCTSLIDWVSEADLPEERVGLREAAGNIGGLLIAIMLESEAEYVLEEAANIDELAAHFRETNSTPGHQSLLDEIRYGVSRALETEASLSIRYVPA